MMSHIRIRPNGAIGTTITQPVVFGLMMTGSTRNGASGKMIFAGNIMVSGSLYFWNLVPMVYA